MKIRKSNKQNKRILGITLIALVVTIVILIIISTISINLALKGGLITRTQSSQREFENQVVKNKDIILGLLGKREGLQTGSLKINSILKSYKKSKINPKFVYQIDGTLNGEIIYSDVASFEYDNPGEKSIILDDIPVGANVTVRAVYTPPSYACNSEQEQNVVIQEDSIVNVKFEDSYTK